MVFMQIKQILKSFQAVCFSFLLVLELLAENDSSCFIFSFRSTGISLRKSSVTLSKPNKIFNTSIDLSKILAFVV